MASAALDEAVFATGVPAEQVGANRRLISALQALERLAGAKDAVLIAYGRAGCRLEARSGGTSGDMDALPEFLVKAVQTASAAFPQISQPRWVDETNGLQSYLLVNVAEEQERTLFLAFWFDNPSAVCRARAMRLLPDLLALLRAQVDLDARLRDMEERKIAITEALDHGECGVIAVRADRSVVFANQAASRHLAAESGLRLWRGSVRSADHQYAGRFEAAIDDVLQSGRGEQRKPARARMMLLNCKDDTQSVIVAIAPTQSNARLDENGGGAAVIIYVLQPAEGVARGLEALCRLHGLSRVESRLLGNLIRGLTITEAAVEMRIKIDTARAYLKQVFAKTGTHRQSELVSLMTRYLRAARGNFDFQPA